MLLDDYGHIVAAIQWRSEYIGNMRSAKQCFGKLTSKEEFTRNIEAYMEGKY
jgi:hypothetical protein